MEQVNISVGGPINNNGTSTYKTVILKPNLPLSAQMQEENCKYIIKWNFNLLEGEIIMPEGSILDFQGGCIKNGTIVGQNTAIEAGLEQVFGTNIDLDGTWNVIEAYPEWFGAKGDGSHDDRLSIQKTLDYFGVIRFSGKEYKIGSTVTLNDKLYGLVINNHSTILQGDALNEWTPSRTKITVENSLQLESVVLINNRCVSIENIAIVGSVGGYINANYGIRSISNYPSTKLKNVYVRFINGTGISLFSYNVEINSCNVSDAIIGFHIYSVGYNNTSAVLFKCAANDCKQYGYWLVNMSYSTLFNCTADNTGYTEGDVVITDGVIENTNLYPVIQLTSCRNIKVLNCACEGCYKVIGINASCVNIDVDTCYFITAYYETPSAQALEKINNNEIDPAYKHIYDLSGEATIRSSYLGLVAEGLSIINCERVFDPSYVNVFDCLCRYKYSESSYPWYYYHSDSPRVNITNNIPHEELDNIVWISALNKLTNVISKGVNIDITNTIYFNESVNIKNFSGDALIKADNVNAILQRGVIFENINSLTFDLSVEISFAYLSALTKCFTIKNSIIKFYNVNFYNMNPLVVDKLFVLYNSQVELNYCSFSFTDTTEIQDVVECHNSRLLIYGTDSLKIIDDNGLHTLAYSQESA